VAQVDQIGTKNDNAGLRQQLKATRDDIQELIRQTKSLLQMQYALLRLFRTRIAVLE
jgi:hypothetical protein